MNYQSWKGQLERFSRRLIHFQTDIHPPSAILWLAEIPMKTIRFARIFVVPSFLRSSILDYSAESNRSTNFSSSLKIHLGLMIFFPIGEGLISNAACLDFIEPIILNISRSKGVKLEILFTRKRKKEGRGRITRSWNKPEICWLEASSYN